MADVDHLKLVTSENAVDFSKANGEIVCPLDMTNILAGRLIEINALLERERNHTS